MTAAVGRTRWLIHVTTTQGTSFEKERKDNNNQIVGTKTLEIPNSCRFMSRISFDQACCCDTGIGILALSSHIYHLFLYQIQPPKNIY